MQRIIDEADPHDKLREDGLTKIIAKRYAKEYSQLCQPRGEWISVKDRLPENSCSVLVATDQGGVGEMWFDNLLNWHVLKENAKVLFWMPLPASPLKKISNVKL